jgi:hypothetical protein
MKNGIAGTYIPIKMGRYNPVLSELIPAGNTNVQTATAARAIRKITNFKKNVEPRFI